MLTLASDGHAVVAVMADGADADFRLDPVWVANETVAWHEWSNPLMPWDGSRIALRTVVNGRPVGDIRILAGGDSESVAQPRAVPSTGGTSAFGWLGETTGFANVTVVAVASSGIALNRNDALRSATSKNQGLRSDVAIERARSSQLLGQIDTLRKTSPVALRLAQLENDPSARNVQLVSATGRALGHVLLAADGEGYIIGDTLPTLPIGRTYQLWGVKDGLVLSLGVMGRAPKVMPFAADERWSQLVLTDEASPGVVASKASAAAVATLDQA